MSKGRDKSCIKKRNLKLIARFYYYSDIIGLKSEKCTLILENEFNIKQATISDILYDNTDVVSSFYKSKISLSNLKNSYPYLNWKYNCNKIFTDSETILKNCLTTV